MFDAFVVQTGYVFMPVDMFMLCSVSFGLRSDVGDRGPVSFGLRSDVGDVGPSQLRTFGPMSQSASDFGPMS